MIKWNIHGKNYFKTPYFYRLVQWLSLLKIGGLDEKIVLKHFLIPPFSCIFATS